MNTFHEPWRVHPYDLGGEPQLVGVMDLSEEPWIYQEWALTSADSTVELARVKFSTAPCGWGHITSRKEAIAIRDRILACVNACAGMEDPEKEIAALRAALAVESGEPSAVTPPTQSPGIVSEENSDPALVGLAPH